LTAIFQRIRILHAMSKRVYLAGPEVFLANARQIGARKRAICSRYGLVGVYPADEEHAPDPALLLPEQAIAISRAMERAMRSCDAMIVNLTPFRSPSADVGSACEMGYMRALDRPIFA
jgi:nucleoside 2-deoxyribosyltransferase